MVYSALDMHSGEEVALKVLRDKGVQNSNAEARFLQEARAAATLDHPNIAAVHHVALSQQKKLYMVMTLYRGQTLKAVIREQALNYPQAFHYAYQLAQGLSKAHNQGIIHRDVKPANVFICEQGLLKILDFGIAKLFNNQLTHTGVTLGTLAYMAPEQIRDEAIDQRIDLWAWGVILFEMLTQHSPFGDNKGVAAMIAILHQEPERLERYLPEHPWREAVQALLDRALCKDPSERYSRAEDIVADLEPFMLSNPYGSQTHSYLASSPAEASELPNSASPADEHSSPKPASSQAPSHLDNNDKASSDSNLPATRPTEALQLSNAEALRPPLTFSSPLTPATDTAADSRQLRPSTAPSASLQQPLRALQRNLAKRPLIGRHNELLWLEQRLKHPQQRLLSIVGAGGAGKTHLAMHAAMRQRQHFHDGVFVLPLESVNNYQAMLIALVQTLGLAVHSHDPLQDISQHIAQRRILLVLDTIEHLLEPASKALLMTLWQHCPQLHLLVTSRTRLHLPAEHVLALRGLAVPEANSTEPSESLKQGFKKPAAKASEEAASVQLFVHIAQRGQLGYQLQEEDKAAVRDICSQLEGWPLGIELAAVWTKYMPCADIAREISKNIDFLQSRWRNVSQRHRSVRAVFEYSWGLLEPTEQQAMLRLTVFSGGFNHYAAQEITEVSLEQLSALVDKSLLYTDSQQRYQHHALVYQFLLDKVQQASPETASVTPDMQLRHARYYRHLLSTVGTALMQGKQRQALQRLEQEIDNIRSAWLTLSSQGEVLEIREALEPLLYYYDQRGGAYEGIRLLQQAFVNLSALPIAYDTAQQLHKDLILAVLRNASAWLHYRLGKLNQASALGRQGLKSLQQLPPDYSQRFLGQGLNAMGMIKDAIGDYPRAKQHFQQALEHYQHSNNSARQAQMAIHLGLMCQYMGQYPQAQQHFEASLQRSQAANNSAGIALALSNLGKLCLETKQHSQALHYLQQAYNLAQDAGYSGLIPYVLENLGTVYRAQGNLSQSQHYLLQALSQAQQSSRDQLTLEVLTSLATTARHSDDYRLAYHYFKQALELASGREFIAVLLHILVELAVLYYHDPQAPDAKARLLLQKLRGQPAMRFVDARRMADYEAKLSASPATVAANVLALEPTFRSLVNVPAQPIHRWARIIAQNLALQSPA